jgi:hypothetical protein
VNPVVGNPTTAEGANGGVYAFRADILGLGGQFTF